MANATTPSSLGATNEACTPGYNTSECETKNDFDHVSLDAEFKLRMVYIAIGSVGVIGNLIVVYVIMSSTKLLASNTNTLIANHSAIDLAASLFIVLTACIRDVTNVRGNLACELFCRLWATNLTAWSFFVSSTYSLLIITLERYFAIVYPLRHREVWSKVKIRITMTTIWLIGPIYNAAYMIPTSAYKEGACTSYSEWPSPLAQSLVGLLTVILQYFIPLAVIFFAYTRIILVLRETVKSGHNTVNDTRTQRLMKARKNVIKTLIMVNVIFFLCWSPNQIMFTMFNLGFRIDFNGAFYHFTVVAVCMNSCINPFVYLSQYRQFQRVLCKPCRKRKSYRGSSADESQQAASSTTLGSVGIGARGVLKDQPADVERSVHSLNKQGLSTDVTSVDTAESSIIVYV